MQQNKALAEIAPLYCKEALVLYDERFQARRGSW
jgi:hypothetical protein